MSFALLPTIAGQRRWTLIDPTGASHILDLAINALMVLPGAEGRYGVPLSVGRQATPFRGGSAVRSVRATEKTLDVPIVAHSDTAALLLGAVRQMVRWSNSRMAPCRLRCLEVDGRETELVLWLERVTVDESAESMGNVQRMMLSFVVPDPYWYDLDDTASSYVLTGGAAAFLDDGTNLSFNFLSPFGISSSTVLASPLIENTGDEEAWPVWTLTGPGADPALRSYSYGPDGVSVIAFSGYTIPPGEQIVIDTRPFVDGLSQEVSATDGRGSSVRRYLYQAPTFFPLVSGVNNLSIEMGGATAASSVSLAWRRRFLTP